MSRLGLNPFIEEAEQAISRFEAPESLSQATGQSISSPPRRQDSAISIGLGSIDNIDDTEAVGGLEDVTSGIVVRSRPLGLFEEPSSGRCGRFAEDRDDLNARACIKHTECCEARGDCSSCMAHQRDGTVCGRDVEDITTTASSTERLPFTDIANATESSMPIVRHLRSPKRYPTDEAEFESAETEVEADEETPTDAALETMSPVHIQRMDKSKQQPIDAGLVATSPPVQTRKVSYEDARRISATSILDVKPTEEEMQTHIDIIKEVIKAADTYIQSPKYDGAPEVYVSIISPTVKPINVEDNQLLEHIPRLNLDETILSSRSSSSSTNTISQHNYSNLADPLTLICKPNIELPETVDPDQTIACLTEALGMMEAYSNSLLDMHLKLNESTIRILKMYDELEEVARESQQRGEKYRLELLLEKTRYLQLESEFARYKVREIKGRGDGKEKDATDGQARLHADVVSDYVMKKSLIVEHKELTTEEVEAIEV